MWRYSRFVVLILVVCLLVGPAAAQQSFGHQSTRDFVFVHANVIPMDRNVILEDYTVVVRAGSIVAAGPSDQIEIPSDATVQDANGMFLLPGLSDFHVHLHALGHLTSYLSHGITTILHLDSGRDELRLREEIHQGQRLGPNMYLSGPRTDGDPPIFPGGIVIKTKEDARRTVLEQKKARFEFIKVYNNVPQEVYAVLVREAKERKLPVVGHIPRKVGAEAVFEAGQALIVHGEEYFFTYFRGPTDSKMSEGIPKPDEAKIPFIVQKTAKAGTAVIPNLSFVAMTQRQLEDLEGVFSDQEIKYLHPRIVERWRRRNVTNRRDLDAFRKREAVKYPFLKKLTYALQQAGVLLITGSDSTAPTVFPGQSTHLELFELVDAGLTPFEALAAATSNPGQFIQKHLGRKEAFGTVNIGQRADVLLLSKNPLENIRNISAIEGVMVAGRWLSKAKLMEMRNELAARYADSQRSGN